MGKSKEVVNELLVEVFNQILTIEEDVLHQNGVKLSMSEVHVLEKIQKTELATMGNIAKSLRITLGTLTTAINTLVKKGYVARRHDIVDRRRVFVSLTEKAEPVLMIHKEFHDKMIDAIFEDLELNKDEHLIKALEKISEYFKNNY